MRAAAPDHHGGVRFSALGARALAVLLVLAAVVTPVSAQPPPSLLALGVPAERYPGNVRSLTAEVLEQRGGVDLGDTLSLRIGSVNITSGQGNPWQTSPPRASSSGRDSTTPPTGDYLTTGSFNFNALGTPIAVERFGAPGAPIAAWAGVRVRF